MDNLHRIMNRAFVIIGLGLDSIATYNWPHLLKDTSKLIQWTRFPPNGREINNAYSDQRNYKWQCITIDVRKSRDKILRWYSYRTNSIL